MKVSALGFGCMRLPVLEGDNARIDEALATDMLRSAIDSGVNYVDTAYPYHAKSFQTGGSSEPFLARALADGYRDKVLLATKLPSWLVESREDMDRFLEEQLERLGTDHIDLYLLHSMNKRSWRILNEHRVFDFLEKAKKNGTIRFAGFSFHDELPLFREIVDAWDWDFCQVMYNYYDENFQAGREGLEYAASKGLGTVIMEPLRGGSLIRGLPEKAERILKAADPGRSKAGWALGWIWAQEAAHVVLSGMSDMDQVEENLLLASADWKKHWGEKEEQAVAGASRMIRELQKVDCTSCGYCMPCPHGIDIPRNFSFCNDHHMLGDPAAKNRYFGFMSEKQRASACIACGECLEKCPQQINIPEELVHVAELFES